MPQGSCLCGKVTFQVKLGSDAPIETSVCHCRPCRKITGGVLSLNLTAPSAAFELKTGDLKTVTTQHVDEGFSFSVDFCPECGTPIYAIPHGLGIGADIKVIQVGVLDDVEYLTTVPKTELNVKHRLPWINQVPGAEQRPAYAPVEQPPKS